MTPKEASIEIELIRAHVERLIRCAQDNATIISVATLTELLHSTDKLREFVGPLRTKSKPRHPPKVPAVPERKTNSECDAYPPPVTVGFAAAEQEYTSFSNANDYIAAYRKKVFGIDYGTPDHILQSLLNRDSKLLEESAGPGAARLARDLRCWRPLGRLE